MHYPEYKQSFILKLPHGYDFLVCKAPCLVFVYAPASTNKQ